MEFDLEPAETTLTRWIDPAPFVPGDPKRRAERCELILKMQVRPFRAEMFRES